jgi:hypothetical protein
MSGRTNTEFEEYGAALEAAGWTCEPVDGGHAYVVPGGLSYAEGGLFGVDFYWEAEEAMDLAGR